MSTFTTIAAMLADELQIDPAELKPDTSLVTLGVDSLAQIEFMFQLEEKFDIRFEGDGTPDLKVVQDIVEIVEKAITEKQPQVSQVSQASIGSS